MIVSLRLFGDLSHYFGKQRVDVELPDGASWRDLWLAVSANYGSLLPAEYWDADSGRFKRSVIVIYDGKDETTDIHPLEHGKEIFLLPPMVGGKSSR